MRAGAIHFSSLIVSTGYRGGKTGWLDEDQVGHHAMPTDTAKLLDVVVIALPLPTWLICHVVLRSAIRRTRVHRRHRKRVDSVEVASMKRVDVVDTGGLSV